MKTKQRPGIITLLLLAPLATLHSAALHVSVTGNDTNPGTLAAPLRTIQHAADLAQPGETITVHPGTYRERIDPPRGGTSDANRIIYQASPGEKVVITGSENVKGWTKVQGDVWKVVIPNSFFGSFNPYSDLIYGDWFSANGRQHHTGAVYLNNDWMIEAAKLDDVLKPNGDQKRPGESLLNLAWLRPANGAAKIPADRFAEKSGTRPALMSEVLPMPERE